MYMLADGYYHCEKRWFFKGSIVNKGVFGENQRVLCMVIKFFRLMENALYVVVYGVFSTKKGSALVTMSSLQQ